jgi:MOSC domain-containing protein YiiM
VDPAAHAAVLRLRPGRATPTLSDMGRLLSLNVGGRTAVAAKSGWSGINKLPADGPVEIRAPGPKHGGLGSGLVGDRIIDVANHGGDNQAVYAYAREDLDDWQRLLDRTLPSGMFGENMTTTGLDVTGARIGEQWRIGDDVLLQVTAPRIPCRTFAVRMEQPGWIRTFVERAVPGAYLRVVQPGEVRAGDPVTIVRRPSHDVTVGLTFRAVTTEPELLPLLLAAEDLLDETRELVGRRTGFKLF